MIFGRYKMIKKLLRIHAKSLSDSEFFGGVLARRASTPQKNMPPALASAALQGFRIAGVPIFCQILATRAARGVRVECLRVLMEWFEWMWRIALSSAAAETSP